MIVVDELLYFTMRNAPPTLVAISINSTSTVYSSSNDADNRGLAYNPDTQH